MFWRLIYVKGLIGKLETLGTVDIRKQRMEGLKWNLDKYKGTIVKCIKMVKWAITTFIHDTIIQRLQHTD